MRENTKTLGGLYVSFQRTPVRHAGPPLQPCWTNEVTAPWRHGRGFLLRVLPFLAVSVGRWAPLEPAKLGLSDDGEVGAVREDAASQAEIEEWRLADLDRLAS